MPEVPKSLSVAGLVGIVFESSPVRWLNNDNSSFLKAALRLPTTWTGPRRLPRIKYPGWPTDGQDLGKLDWKNVIDGIGKATVAVFIFDILARLAMAFGIAIEGMTYLDALFVALLILTVAGYGVYYGRTYGAPVSLAATVISGVCGFAFVLIALLGFTIFSSVVRTQLFWLGVLLLAIAIPLGSYASRRIRRDWRNYVTDFDFGHHKHDLARDFGGCADGRKSLSAPALSEPVVSSDGGSCEGAGVRVEWDRGSIVFLDGENAVAVEGRGSIETSRGRESLDGICVVSTTCPLEVREPSEKAATDADASLQDFKTIAELKASVGSASTGVVTEAESFVKEVISRYNPGEKAGSVSVGGFVNVEESAQRKVVRVPGVYVYEGPEGQVVRVGGKVVKNEIRGQGEAMGFSGVFKEGEKPVTIVKNLSEGLSLVVVGPRWVAWKKDEKVSS
jgi:phosphate/sulfate permease